MNASSLEQLKEIFHAARELPPGERDGFLVEACGSDRPLRAKVDALLESDRVADDFIADPPARLVADAFDAAPEPSVAGRMIDRYRIVREIGRGGMGAVYLAERADDQYQKQVALKLIKRGMDTESVLRHFRNERQILAGFDHPNIARLLDGGTSDDGLPYFVMEFVEGLPIDEVLQHPRAFHSGSSATVSRNLRRRFLRASASGHSSRHQTLEHFSDGGGRAEAARFRHR